MAKFSAKKVRESLLEQLAIKGAAIPVFEDLIHDYMSFWETKNKLAKDIKDRGVVYEDVSSVGIKMQKNNPSVKELIMLNRQMLSILKELELSTENVGATLDNEL